jgi:hypothetical protein
MHVASSSPPLAWMRPALLGLAALQLATGLALLLTPREFHDAVANFGPFNAHNLRDNATFYLASAGALAVAVRRPSWRAPVLALVGAQFLAHTLVHIADAGDADPSWVGPVDVATLALGAVAFAAAYRAAARAEHGR